MVVRLALVGATVMWWLQAAVLYVSRKRWVRLRAGAIVAASALNAFLFLAFVAAWSSLALPLLAGSTSMLWYLAKPVFGIALTVLSFESIRAIAIRRV
jgi:hypothetical protein